MTGADDYLSAYEALHERLAVVVKAHECDRPVPACPGWRVHDVIAHLTGLCEDWVGHHLDGYASEAWTADQVSRHADDSCPEILQLWAETMVSFAELDQALLDNPPARWAFGDAVIHEADIRGAVDAGRVPDSAVLLALSGSLARWEAEVLRGAGTSALHIRAPDGPDWWLGRTDDPDAVLLEAPIYEVFRALAGRRTPEQVRRWSWSADPEPFIEAGLPYPFHWATSPLAD